MHGLSLSQKVKLILADDDVLVTLRTNMEKFDADDPYPLGEEIQKEVIYISEVVGELLYYLVNAVHLAKKVSGGEALTKKEFRFLGSCNRLVNNCFQFPVDHKACD